MNASDENRRKEISALLKRGEAALYRSLGKPPTLGDFEIMFDEQRIEEETEERRARSNEYKREAGHFWLLARHESNRKRRAEFERAAQANDQFAQALDTLLAEHQNVDIRAEWAALERAVAESEGRARFNQLEPSIRKRLCAQWHACEKVKRYEDEIALTMAISDVLMALGSTVPVATLAVLVVKIGVKKICNCPA